jgi:predicted dehydrogenase
VTSPVRLGVIGTGWGKVHAQAARELDGDFEVSAIWSRSAHQCQATAAALGLPDSACEADWQALIDRDDVDAVVIAAPDQLHSAIAIEAAGKGKHLVCEKPLAQTSAEAETMLDAVHAAGVRHFTGFLWRYAAPVATVKDLLERDRLGSVLALDMQFRIGPPRPGREWQHVRHGGVLSNLVVHMVDLVRYLQAPGQGGGDPRAWQVWAHTAAPDGADSEGLPASRAWLHLECETGLSVRMQASQDWGVRTAFPLRIEVHGSRASAVACANPLRPESDRVELIEQLSGAAEPQALCYPGGRPVPPGSSTSASAYLLPATRHLYRAFVLPALRHRPAGDAPTFADGLLAQRVIDTALRAASSGTWQSISW